MRKKLLMGFCALLFSIGSILAQNTTVTGKVTDEKGAGLSGATILEKGTKNGTASNADGTFSLKVKSNSKLIISAIGYESKEVASSSNVSIKLTEDVKSLSEVVVTGTGVATSKKKLGISVESITADKLPAAPTASIDQALIGKIPGAQISTTSGVPGAPVNILLRGINSINGGTKPLILVDGVEVRSTDINSLDLANVERVEVVQDAASATIYGAQGANGVIQIFTKKGKKGAVAINYSTSYSSNTFINSGNVQKSQFHPYKVDANNNILNASTGLPVVFNADGTLPTISYKYGYNGGTAATRYAIMSSQNINNTPYNGNLKFYDQFKQVFQTGYTLNNSLSLSGGSDNSDYAISVSNNHTLTPILQNGYLDRTNVTANIGTTVFKGFKIRSITQLVYTKNTMVRGLGGGGGFFGGTADHVNGANIGGGVSGGVYGFLNTSPFFDLTFKFADGTPSNYLRANYLSVNNSNPYYLAYYGKSNEDKIDVIQNFNANYQVNKFVELDAKYGINFRTQNARWTYLNQSQNISTAKYFTNVGPYAPDLNGEIENWQYNNTFQNLLTTATIRFDFQKDFHIKLPIKTVTIGGFDYRKNKYKEYDTYGVGLPLVPPINIQSTSTQAVLFDYEEPFVTYGYLVDQKIDIGDWGGVTGGFRTDWSSNFGSGSKPFTFPHANGYVLPSAFSFWQNNSVSKIVPFFKLKASYGEAGIQPGAFQRIVTIGQGNVGNQLAYSLPQSSNNPNLDVEVSKASEIGTEFTINLNKGKKWANQLNAGFSYWTHKSQNVIYQVSAPISTGYTGLLTNAIDLSSKGYQFQINIPVYRDKDFSWDFTTNFGHQTSTIDRVNGEVAPITATAGSATLKVQAGEKIGQLYGLKQLKSINDTRLDGTPYFTQATIGKYQTVNGGLVDTATKLIQFTNDSYAFGDPNPKFNASFINTFGYKDYLTFSFQFDWVNGSHLYNQTKEWMYRDGIHGDFDKQVTINGVTAAYTAYHASAYYSTFGAPYGSANNSTKDYFYEDASFVRLRNIAIGFDIAKFTKIKYFKKLQLVLTGRNLLTFTKYTGFDPELNSGPANSSLERGIDHSSLPNIKSYQVGLNVGF